MVGLLAGLLLSVVSTPIGYAAEQDIARITLSPTQKRYDLDAGASTRDYLTVLNDGTNGYDLILYARPYGVNDPTYDPDFSSTKSNADAYKWVQFDQASYYVEAGQSIKIPYTITVPEGAAPGGHYGVLFAETQEKPPSEGGAAIARNKRVGALLYANVKGDYIVGGETTKLEIAGLQSVPPMVAKTNTKNTGNSDFINTVGMKVSDVFGNLKYSAQQEYVVLPGTSRDITAQWANSPWLGIYKVEIHSSLLGKDTTKSSYVLMAPAWFYLTLFIILMAGATYAVVRWRKKH